jgi:TrmH family RNA methyltransferase
MFTFSQIAEQGSPTLPERIAEHMISIPTRRQISEWARLTQKKFRRERGQFLIQGEVCVREAMHAHLRIEAVLILASEYQEWAREFPSSIPVFALSASDFARFAKIESTQGIIAVARTFELPTRPGRLALACEQVSDPGNCGALMRVAEFFGAGELHLGPGSAEIYNPKVVRGSMGALFHLPVRSDANLKDLVCTWKGASVAAVAHGGQPLSDAHELKRPILLVLGHETRGLSEEIARPCSHRFTLSPLGKSESLNLVTAAAVFAYALSDLP